MILPRLRDEVQLSALEEDGQRYLVLHDPFGVADGPIMLHADMIEVLAACDGETSTVDLAAAAGVDPEGAEILRVEMFVRQIDELGFFESPESDRRRSQALQQWTQAPTRPMVCADSTYPLDASEFIRFCREELGISQRTGQDDASQQSTEPAPTMALIPHIDFRVAPKAYGEVFNAISTSNADLVVMIGTSHYWAEHPVIVGTKPFETPLGLVPVIDHDLGDETSDIAHKPEHSLELHAVLLRYLWPDRDFSVLPVLVTSSVFEQGALQVWIDRIRHVVDAYKRKAIWLISGDLAHIGPKFGDQLPAADLLPEVQRSDALLLERLSSSDIDSYHVAISSTNNENRICGHAPTLLALQCQRTGHGQILHYGVWDDTDTESAVTFASIVWQ